MKRLIFLLALVLITFSCREDNPQPFYEVVPVVEVTNPFFDEVYNVRLNNTLIVNGESTTQSWDIKYKGVRFGCNLLKWTGEPIEYIVGTELEFTVQVLYDVTDDGGGVLIENFTSGYLPREATWIRVYFEVRDRNKPSNKFLGIEEHSNPDEGEYQAPSVVWTVTDLNNIPSSGGQASPNSAARIANGFEVNECEDCIWNSVN